MELDHDSDDIITVEGLTTESRLNKTGNLENGPVSLSLTGKRYGSTAEEKVFKQLILVTMYKVNCEGI